jgi:tRNA pseudouridine55 synthase
MTGILLVDKPEGFTSHDVIAKLRKALCQKGLGHAGTLDPMATGLLVVLVGRATRAAQFIEAETKEYYANFRLGAATDTQDIWGKVISLSGVSIAEKEVGKPYFSDKSELCKSIPSVAWVEQISLLEMQLCKLLPSFKGEQLQLPPMFSALKRDGKKLYELARRGEEIEREARKITIYELEFLGREWEEFSLRISCSKGTYIRTLCHDIGQALGCGGVMSTLRRTKIGKFSVENALTLKEIEAYAQLGTIEEKLLPIDTIFANIPAYILNEDQKRKYLCGNSFPVSAEGGEYRLYDSRGVYMGTGRVLEGVMITVKSFFEV